MVAHIYRVDKHICDAHVSMCRIVFYNSAMEIGPFWSRQICIPQCGGRGNLGLKMPIIALEFGDYCPVELS